MKTKPIIVLAALSMIFLTLPSCQKESADPSRQKLTLQASDKAFAIPVTGVSSISSNPAPPMVEWEQARMIISRITLTTQSTAGSLRDTSNQLLWQGPGTVDLFEMSELLSDMGLKAGLYSSIRYELEALESDAGNDPVLYLSGNYTQASGKSVPLVIEVREDIVISTERNNVRVPESGFSQNIELFMNRLFIGIMPENLEEATMTDGRILISEESNPELYAQILENLKKRFGGDDDGTADHFNANNKE